MSRENIEKQLQKKNYILICWRFNDGLIKAGYIPEKGKRVVCFQWFTHSIKGKLIPYCQDKPNFYIVQELVETLKVLADGSLRNFCAPISLLNPKKDIRKEYFAGAMNDLPDSSQAWTGTLRGVVVKDNVFFPVWAWA